MTNLQKKKIEKLLNIVALKGCKGTKGNVNRRIIYQILVEIEKIMKIDTTKIFKIMQMYRGYLKMGLAEKIAEGDIYEERKD